MVLQNNNIPEVVVNCFNIHDFIDTTFFLQNTFAICKFKALFKPHRSLLNVTKPFRSLVTFMKYQNTKQKTV